MYTTNLHDDSEKRMNMCVANSDVQKNSTVSNEDGVEIFIGRISGFLRTAYRERFTIYCKPMISMESVCTPKECFLTVSTHQLSSAAKKNKNGFQHSLHPSRPT